MSIRFQTTFWWPAFFFFYFSPCLLILFWLILKILVPVLVLQIECSIPYILLVSNNLNSKNTFTWGIGGKVWGKTPSTSGSSNRYIYDSKVATRNQVTDLLREINTPQNQHKMGDDHDKSYLTLTQGQDENFDCQHPEWRIACMVSTNDKVAITTHWLRKPEDIGPNIFTARPNHHHHCSIGVCKGHI